MTVQGNVLGFPILSLITFLPLVGVILLLMVGREQIRSLRNLAFLVSVATFAVSLPIPFAYDQTTPAVQLVERASWIPTLGVTYFVGLDGISLWLVMLTTFLTPLAILCSFESIQHRPKEYYVFLLVLETGMLGVPVPGLFPVLRLLGGHAGPHVLPHRGLGQRPPPLLGHQVLPVYALRQRGHAAGDPGHLLLRCGAAGRYTFDMLELMRVAYPHPP